MADTMCGLPCNFNDCVHYLDILTLAPDCSTSKAHRHCVKSTHSGVLGMRLSLATVLVGYSTTFAECTICWPCDLDQWRRLQFSFRDCISEGLGDASPEWVQGWSPGRGLRDEILAYIVYWFSLQKRSKFVTQWLSENRFLTSLWTLTFDLLN